MSAPRPTPAAPPPTSQPQTKVPRSTLRAIVISFRYAFAGLFYVFRTQRNFRIHLSITLLASLLGIFLGLSFTEWAVFAATVTIVLAAEMTNTMIEALVDLVSPEYHPLAKVSKDVAAGIVLLTALGAIVVGLFLFGPKLLTAMGKS